LLDTNLFIVLYHFPGAVYNDFYAVSNHQLSVDRGEFSQTLDCVSRSGTVDWQSTCDDSLLHDTKLYTHELLHPSGGKDSDVSALEHSITHREEPYSSQSLYLEKSISRRLPNAYLHLDRDRDDQYRLHRGEPPLIHAASMSNADGVITRPPQLYKLRPQSRPLITRLSILCLLRGLQSLR
jgi:hypothetical protein